METNDPMDVDENLELIHLTNTSPKELLEYWPKYFPNEYHVVYNVKFICIIGIRLAPSTYCFFVS